jgi:uncharacterized damage-inducible protein DinB
VSIAQSLLNEFDEEMASTRKILERVPDGNTDWKPHEKSMSLGRLATHVAQLPFWAVNSLAVDHIDVNPAQKPVILEKRSEIMALFDENLNKARAALTAATDEDFGRPWSLKVAGKVIFTQTRSKTYRVFTMNHMIHHRAQLGVYLRLLGVPLPGLYGPTADERPF